MNILFDLSSTQPISGNDFHGGSEYAKTVFYRLCELICEEHLLEVFYNPQNEIDKSLIEKCNNNKYVINLCKSNKDISNLLSLKKYNVFYTALSYSYFDLIIPPETKFIYTIHGVRSLEYPVDKFELKYKLASFRSYIKHFIYLFLPLFWLKYKSRKSMMNFKVLFSLAKNKNIITVSNHSKYAISYFFPQLNNYDMKVFYSPLKQFILDNGKNNQILSSLSLHSGKYILLIGGDRSEKGAYRACKVLDTLVKNHSRFPEDIKILVLGVSHFKSYTKLVNNNPRFIFHGYVSSENLETLYNNAHLFLYPTLNEGFGYPPLEAMKYGTLCACSANSAITEIYGDSVLYFNPFDETEMSIRILQSFDEDIRRSIVTKAAIRYQVIRKRQDEDLDLLVKTIISS